MLHTLRHNHVANRNFNTRSPTPTTLATRVPSTLTLSISATQHRERLSRHPSPRQPGNPLQGPHRDGRQLLKSHQQARNPFLSSHRLLTVPLCTSAQSVRVVISTIRARTICGHWGLHSLRLSQDVPLSSLMTMRNLQAKKIPNAIGRGQTPDLGLEPGK